MLLKPSILIKKELFLTGIAFAKQGIVKHPISYKIITLVLGILIALIIAFTLWVKSPEKESAHSINFIPKISLPVAKSIVKSVSEIPLF
jgi:hypothetical protein